MAESGKQTKFQHGCAITILQLYDIHFIRLNCAVQFTYDVTLLIVVMTIDNVPVIIILKDDPCCFYVKAKPSRKHDTLIVIRIVKDIKNVKVKASLP